MIIEDGGEVDQLEIDSLPNDGQGTVLQPDWRVWRRIYRGRNWLCCRKGWAEEQGLGFVPWRDVFVKDGQYPEWVLGDDGIVQPVVAVIRRTMLVTPYMHMSRLAPEKKLLAKTDKDRRIGGRGYTPPGEGELTEKHLAFCQVYVSSGMDPEAAFSMVWGRFKNTKFKIRHAAKKLLMDPKIQGVIMGELGDIMEQYGVGNEFLMKQLKEQIEKGTPETRGKMLMTAMSLKGLVTVPVMTGQYPVMPGIGSGGMKSIPASFTEVDTPQKEAPTNDDADKAAADAGSVCS